MQDALNERGVDYTFDVVSNPEFLREGSAVRDFTHPDRVVIGAENEKAINLMKDVYRVLYINETPFVITNIETAEIIKYASNAFLAMKITFINEVANLCEKVGADVQKVAKAMGKDGRISPNFYMQVLVMEEAVFQRIPDLSSKLPKIAVNLSL